MLKFDVICRLVGQAGCLAQLVERRPYKANVSGSTPLAPTKKPTMMLSD